MCHPDAHELGSKRPASQSTSGMAPRPATPQCLALVVVLCSVFQNGAEAARDSFFNQPLWTAWSKGAAARPVEQIFEDAYMHRMYRPRRHAHTAFQAPAGMHTSGTATNPAGSKSTETRSPAPRTAAAVHVGPHVKNASVPNHLDDGGRDWHNVLVWSVFQRSASYPPASYQPLGKQKKRQTVATTPTVLNDEAAVNVTAGKPSGCLLAEAPKHATRSLCKSNGDQDACAPYTCLFDCKDGCGWSTTAEQCVDATAQARACRTATLALLGNARRNIPSDSHRHSDCHSNATTGGQSRASTILVAAGHVLVVALLVLFAVVAAGGVLIYTGASTNPTLKLPPSVQESCKVLQAEMRVAVAKVAVWNWQQAQQTRQSPLPEGPGGSTSSVDRAPPAATFKYDAPDPAADPRVPLYTHESHLNSHEVHQDFIARNRVAVTAACAQGRVPQKHSTTKRQTTDKRQRSASPQAKTQATLTKTHPKTTPQTPAKTPANTLTAKSPAKTLTAKPPSYTTCPRRDETPVKQPASPTLTGRRAISRKLDLSRSIPKVDTRRKKRHTTGVQLCLSLHTMHCIWCSWVLQ